MSRHPRRTALPVALLGAALAAGACSATPRAGPPSSPGPEAHGAIDARVTAIADSFLAAFLERNPEWVTAYGIPGGRHDRLTDNSLEALRRWQAREDAWLAALRRIERPPVGTRAWVTYGILREQLESAVGARGCRTELWGLNQLVGWQTDLAYVASIQPVGSDSLRAEALARWRALPRFVDTEITNLREGVRRGYTAPRRNAELVLRQVDAIADAPADSSPFFGPARRDSTPAFRAAFARLVADEINPALRRYRDYLAGEYVPAARRTDAVSALPDGAACYRALLRAFSTLDVPPERAHQMGLEQMARIEAEMAEIARRSFGTTDVRGLLDRLKTDTQYTYRTRDEVIAHSRAAVERATRATPRWFGLVPRAQVVIEPYPAFRERDAVGEYRSPAEDGSRPGTFFISTYEPLRRSRSGPEAVAFHETIPGHHLQVAVALERGANHAVARYFINSGFVEGWALYAERLADEMGLYASDLDRMGMLSEQAFRAARLVVDPGLHALGWTRQQAIDYIAARTVAPQAEVVAEVDRYIVWPGQASSYMLGMLEIRRLREQAERTLGPRFDVRAFHDRVLENGSVTLPMLREAVERWVAGAR